MEETFEFTKSDLIEAFMKWNKSIIDYPENVDNILTIIDYDYCVARADCLLGFLKNNL
jgi:hypothetical protein